VGLVQLETRVERAWFQHLKQKREYCSHAASTQARRGAWLLLSRVWGNLPRHAKSKIKTRLVAALVTIM
jgi:hypothetical protein